MRRNQNGLHHRHTANTHHHNGTNNNDSSTMNGRDGVGFGGTKSGGGGTGTSSDSSSYRTSLHGGLIVDDDNNEVNDMDTSWSKLDSRAALYDKYKARSSKRLQAYRSAGGGGLGGVGSGGISKGKRNRRRSYTRLIIAGLLATIPIYLVGFYIYVHIVWGPGRGDDVSLPPSGKGPRFDYFDLLRLSQISEGKRADRTNRDNDEVDWQGSQTNVADMTAHKRRRRTRPPMGVRDADVLQHEFLLSDQQSRREYDERTIDVEGWDAMERAGVEDLCGHEAQNASIEHGEYYRKRDVLNKDSRVIITGILNPIGFHLALALKERCQVETIVAMDAMFPNTVPNRMALQEQLQLLTTNFAKMVKPFFVSFVGIDPQKVNKKGLSGMDTTGEIDLTFFNPTHIVHLASYGPELFSNALNWEWRNQGSPYVTESYDPPLYPIRQSMTAMEHILASVSEAEPDDRPHLVYASSSLLHHQQQTSASEMGDSIRATRASASLIERDEVVHTHTKLIDEILADAYYATRGIFSVAVRVPNAIYGRWGHPSSALYQVLKASVAQEDYNATVTEHPLDMVYIDNVIDSLLAAMQFRSKKPIAFELSSEHSVTIGLVREAARGILDRNVDRPPEFVPTAPTREAAPKGARSNAANLLGWRPSTTLLDGLVKTLAWHLDRANPHGRPVRPLDEVVTSSDLSVDVTLETGDELLERFHLPTCAADDRYCHSGHLYVPCASECSTKRQCLPSVFDSIMKTTRTISQGCYSVLYTQALGSMVTDLKLNGESGDDKDGGNALCNFAFVSSESRLVQHVVNQVPDSQLEHLGVHPPEDKHDAVSFLERKIEKLSGKLLYRGWILIWDTEGLQSDGRGTLSFPETTLLKLSPGRLFNEAVKFAIFIDQSFPVAAKPDDIKFLVHQMRRPSWKPRIVKRKTRPKANFLLPAEPERRAVLLMSELKFQESSETERLPPGEKITVLEATRFMRYELGEEPLVKEDKDTKAQREFYERIPAYLNRDIMKSNSEPAYKFEMSAWARSRWVVHDLEHDEGRKLRCDWYREHIEWGNELDQLSFAYVMARREIDRRVALVELDDNVVQTIDEKTQVKKLLSDTFEWISLKTPQNKRYSPYEEMRMLPYEMDYPEEVYEGLPTHSSEGHQLVFTRIISDRLMSYARQVWNSAKIGEGNGE